MMKYLANLALFSWATSKYGQRTFQKTWGNSTKTHPSMSFTGLSYPRGKTHKTITKQRTWQESRSRPSLPQPGHDGGLRCAGCHGRTGPWGSSSPPVIKGGVCQPLGSPNPFRELETIFIITMRTIFPFPRCRHLQGWRKSTNGGICWSWGGIKAVAPNLSGAQGFHPLQ